MAMSWTETCQLLGLDLLAVMLLTVALLDAVDRALHLAWATARSWRARAAGADFRPQPLLGSAERA